MVMGDQNVGSRETFQASKPLPDDPWQGRTEGMRCRTCISFCRKQGTVGRCRRHAPTMRGFPVVFETDWCGDHRLNEESVEASAPGVER